MQDQILTGLLVICLLTGVAVGQPAQSPCCVENKDQIIAWWTFDECQTDTAKEIVDGNNGLCINDPVYAAGMVENALWFDGSDDYVEVPDNDLWAFGTNDFTIELWANFNDVVGGSLGQPGVYLVSNDQGEYENPKWAFALGGDLLHFVVCAPPIATGFFSQVLFIPSIGEWYHLAVTRSGNTFSIYINGVPMGSEENDIVIPNPDAPLTIGWAEGTWGFMDGYLDEVTIYSKALTEEELLDIYTAGRAGKCKNFYCGDANGDRAINIGDAVYLLNYIFNYGPPPINDCRR